MLLSIAINGTRIKIYNKLNFGCNTNIFKIKEREENKLVPVKFTESVEVLFEVRSSVLGNSTGAEATSNQKFKHRMIN